MKLFRRILLLLSLSVCLCLWANAADYTYTAPDGSYSLRLTNQTSSSLCLKGFAETPSEPIAQLVIPSEVEGLQVSTVSSNAFEDCTMISSVVFPEGITAIYASAFEGCSGLTGQLTLPSTLTYLASSVFKDCSGLSGDLILPDGVTQLMYSVFYGCSGLDGTLSLPSDLVSVDSSAFYGCSGLTGTLTIPEGVTAISREAFYNCSGFTTLGSYAFSGCSGFTGRLVIPAGLSIIPERAFSNCSSLSNLTLPQGPCSVRNYAFENCTGFSGSRIIPYTITNVYNTAFSNCYGFSSIYVPTDTSVFVISSSTIDNFSGCTGIMHVYYGGTEEQWNSQGLRLNAGFGEDYIVHYESYADAGIQIQGDHHSVPFSQTITLQAAWGGTTPASRSDFSWSSSDSSLLAPVSSTCVIDASGLSAQLTATFRADAEGDVTVTVFGPNGASDTCTVSSSGQRSIRYVPHTDQTEGQPLYLSVGDAETLTFRYSTSSDLETDLQSIQWSAAGSCLTLSEPAYEITGSSTALLTATVTGVSAADPVTVTVTGPDGCTASCQVCVVSDKVLFLDKDRNVPSDDTKALYCVCTGDQFDIFLRYETRAEDLVLEDVLNSITWVQSKYDFMVHPDDLAVGAGDASPRGSTIAYPAVPVECVSKDENGYLLKATFAAALEGACGLKVQIGDYYTDTCIVISSFDSETYLAGLLHDTAIPTTHDMYTMLHGDTPATVMLDILKEDGGYQASSVVWETMDGLLNALEKPSGIYDLCVKEEDMYFGMLLEMLRGSIQEDKSAAILNGIKFSGELTGSIGDCHKMLYDPSFSLLSKDFFLDHSGREMLTEIYESKHPGTKSVSAVTKHLDTIASTAKGITDLVDRIYSSIMLKEISDSNLTLLEQMLKECDNYENCDALKSAIEKCIVLVQASTEESMNAIMAGTAAATGIKAVGTLLDSWWGKLMDEVKLTHPVVAMVYAGYHSGTTLSNLLGATDATLEEYYNLVALQNIKTIARDAHDTLSADWQNDPAAYLAAVKALFHIHLLDCDHAIRYVDIADDALLSKAIEQCGGTGFADANAAFTAFRSNIETMYYAYQVLWLDYVTTDYPGVLLDSLYESVFSDILPVDREVFFACPVEIHVMDGEDEVAFVSDGSLYTDTDDITVMLDPGSPITTLQMPAGDTTLTAQLKVAELPSDRLTLTDPNGLVYRHIPQTTFDLRFSSAHTCFVASYDANGKLLSVLSPKSSAGTVTVSLDNCGGLIAEIKLFRVCSLENPTPEADCLQISDR